MSLVNPVFPACAGMFLFPWPRTRWGSCFPRMRGDVPVPSAVRVLGSSFSPHARGCSRYGFPAERGCRVFPACAGMFLFRSRTREVGPGFPRMRGDVPSLRVVSGRNFLFSPHARGCSSSDFTTVNSDVVFPACAGMFPIAVPLGTALVSFPRMRGDVPAAAVLRNIKIGFSPHARGCSLLRTIVSGFWGVFPACAGMFPGPENHATHLPRFPRMRGDVPYGSTITTKFM